MTLLELHLLPELTNGFLIPPTIKFSPQAVLVRGKFNCSAFSADLYRRLSITMPVQIESSVFKRRAEFLAGRVMAAIAQRALGCNAKTIHIGPQRSPVWPDGLKGSITHTAEHCAALLVAGGSHYYGSGIDIEPILTGEALDAVSGMVMQPGDYRCIKELDIAFNTAVTLIFSARETLFKALFPKLGRRFDACVMKLVQPLQKSTIIFQLTETLHPDLSEGKLFHIVYEIHNDTVMTWIM